MDERAQRATWTFAERDLNAAADFLRERPEIHSANLTVVGIGAGCALALRHARDDVDVRAVVLIRPQSKSFGVDAANAVAKVAGLPCLIMAPKDERQLSDDLRETGRSANDGQDAIEVQILQCAPDEVLKDKRLASSVSKWLAEKLMPKEGR